MSTTQAEAGLTEAVAPRGAEPLLELPGGFPPDTIGFALRMALAVLLAYYLAFSMQLAAASSAGLCVAVVVQPGHGATVSKSIFRVLGTVAGGAVAVAAMAAFPQDRTILLIIFVLWIGFCTFASSLFRDVGAYGTALAGYTFGIIALANLDSPEATVLTTVHRVAAIVLGIVCAGLVNGVLSRPGAYRDVARGLHQAIDRVTESAIAAIHGDARPVSGIAAAEQASAILALRTQVANVASESQDGRFRAAGARSAIVALLGMMSLARFVAVCRERHAPDAETGRVLDSVVAGLENPHIAPQSVVSAPSLHADLHQAFLRSCSQSVLEHKVLALDGLMAVRTGARPLRDVRLAMHNDVPGAVLTGVRAAIGTALAVVFCVYGGWNGATLMLIQISAYAALLGRQVHPTQAAVLLGVLAPLPILAAGFVEFFLLPQGGSFLLFTLAIAPFIILAAVASRHPRISAAGNGMLVLFLLALTPTNPQNYDPIAFLNTAACLVGSVIATVSGFVMILPVSPSRRRFRLFQAVANSLRDALSGRRLLDLPTVLTLQFDRLASALVWLGPRTPARVALVGQLGDLAGLDAVLCRAHDALESARADSPHVGQVIDDARSALVNPTTERVAEAAGALLAAASASPGAPPTLLRAAVVTYAVSLQLDRQSRLLKRLDLVGPM